MKAPKISVIMPTYNTPADFFRQAIDSILNQTYTNLELIIVDDGSESKHISNITNSYDDNRIVYINEGHNGAGPARNIGIKHSSGDYIYIMASDDTLDLDTFTVCVELINNHNPDIVLFNLYGDTETKQIHKYKTPIPLGITNPGDTTQLCKRSLIIDNDIKYENLTSCNDLTFTYTILAYAQSAVKIDRCFYHYNTNVPNQISSKRGAKSKNVFLAFDALKRNLNNKSTKTFKHYKKTFYNIFAGCVKYEMKFIHNEERLSEFLSILKSKYYNVYRRVFDYKFKLIGKQRFDNGKRSIYFCGKKLFSYCKHFYTDLSLFNIDIKKHHAYIANQKHIKTLVLGASTARDGFLPEPESDFNLGTSSQDLYRTYNLYKWCTQTKSTNLKNIVLFFDVFTPGLQLEKTSEAYKAIIYKYLYNIPYAFKLHKKYRKFENSCATHFKSAQTITKEYYGQSFYDSVNHKEYVQSIVQKHIKNNQRNNNQIAYLEQLIIQAQENKHNIYVVIPPYRNDYKQHLPDHKIVFHELYNMLEKHNTVTLLNFLNDNDFNSEDFNDCHHLNKNGAIKLTKKIKNALKQKMTKNPNRQLFC